MICKDIFKTQFRGLASLTTFFKVLVIHCVLKLNFQPPTPNNSFLGLDTRIACSALSNLRPKDTFVFY